MRQKRNGRLPTVLGGMFIAASGALADTGLEILEQRCEAAREKVIAPLRAAEIAKCKSNRRNDPAWCERFWADYGDGGRTAAGTYRPRLFDDLPECKAALEARRGRVTR